MCMNTCSKKLWAADPFERPDLTLNPWFNVEQGFYIKTNKNGQKQKCQQGKIFHFSICYALPFPIKECTLL